MKNTPDNIFLTGSPDSKKEYIRIIEKTASAVADSMPADGSAYSGPEPDTLAKLIGSLEFLPDEPMGFEKCLESAEKDIFPYFLRPSSTSYMAHLHSPPTLESVAAELVLSTFNQSMDSWDQSPVATELELAAVKNLLRMYNYTEGSDGVFTSGGSQSNQYGIHLARDWFCREKLNRDVKKHGLPECFGKLRLYTSSISHFSMEKIAHLLGLGYDAVVKVPVDGRMKMDTSELEKAILKDISEGNMPFCAVATIGTTDFGSIDPLEEISALCVKYGMWLHADAAYGSGLVLSEKYAERTGKLNLADSITVDFHKMFLSPISGSAFLLKNGAEFETFELHADYLNREEDEEDGYVNLVGKSMQTTRRFDALKIWMAFRTRGRKGWSELITKCVDNAAYLYGKLSENKAFQVTVEPEISSVVFRLDASDDVNKRVRRKLLLEHGTVIGQTVFQGKVCLKFTLLNPLVTHEKLDSLIELIRSLA